MTITLGLKDDMILSEPVADQPALHDLLYQVRNPGLKLISVDRVQGVD
jgi:hypothetical protein